MEKRSGVLTGKLFFWMVIGAMAWSCAQDNSTAAEINGIVTVEQNVINDDALTINGDLDLTGSLAVDGIGGHDADRVSVIVNNGGAIRIAGGSDAVAVDGIGHNAIELRDSAIVTVSAGGQVINDGADTTDNGLVHNSAIVARDDALVTVGGTVETRGAENEFSPAILIGANGLVTVQNTGLVKTTNLKGPGVELGLGSELVNNGTIQALKLDDPNLGAVHSNSDNITVTNNGFIEGSKVNLGVANFGYILHLEGVGNVITNTGTMTSNGYGLYMLGGTINNSGIITAVGDALTVGTLDLTNSGYITGRVRGVLDAAHTVSIIGGTIDGNITLHGATANTYTQSGGTVTGTVDLGDGADHAVTLGGGTIGHLDVGTGTTTVTVNTATTFDLKSLEGNQPTVNMTGTGELIISGNLPGSLDIDAGITRFAGSFLVPGGIDQAAGTLRLGSNTITVNSNSSFGAGTIIATQVNYSTLTAGQVKSNGTADITMDNGTIVQVTVAGTPADNASVVIVDATGAALTVSPGDLTLDVVNIASYADWSFELEAIGQQLLVTSTLVSGPDFIDPDHNSVDTVVTQAFTGDSQLLTALNGLGTSEEKEQAYDTLKPNASAPVQQASISAYRAAAAPVQNRIRTWRGPRAAQSSFPAQVLVASAAPVPVLPMASSDNTLKYTWQIWAEGFAAKGDQNRIGNDEGYEMDAQGITFGLDRALSQSLFDNMLIGVAYSYIDSNTTRDITGSTGDIQSDMIMLYSSATAGDYFGSLRLGYGVNDYQSLRRIQVGGVQRQAFADYDGNQFDAFGELGRNFNFRGTTISPALTGAFTYLDVDGYTEGGAGGANLTVDGDTYAALELGMDLKISRIIRMGQWQIEPRLRLAYTYELLDEGLDTSAAFASGGGSFVTHDIDVGRHRGITGAGLTLGKGRNWEIKTDYEFSIKKEYQGHAGKLSLQMMF